MSRKIIALSGFKGAGKDESAKVIESCLEEPIILAFADPVKDAVSVIFGIDREILSGKTPESREKREEPDEFWKSYLQDSTPRYLLTLLGTDIIREHILDDLWSLTLKRKLLDNPDRNFIITDLRYPTEEKMLYELRESHNEDVTHIRVIREEPDWKSLALNKQYSDIESLGIHSSEYEQYELKPDIEVDNHGTLKELNSKIISVMSDIL